MTVIGKNASRNDEDLSSPFAEMVAPYCISCNIHFKCDRYYIDHYTQKHEGVFPYACHFCGYGYNSKHRLKDHWILKHSHEKDYFPLRLRVKMNNETLFYCKICTAGFRCTLDLETHGMNSHPGEKVIPCSECGRLFRKRSSLQVHFRQNHSSAKFFCKYCRKMSETSEKAESHKKNCERMYFKRHMMSEKVFGAEYPPAHSIHCHLCSETFSYNNQYRKHYAEKHPGVKSYACKYCPQEYYRRDRLVRHMDVKHPQEIEKDDEFRPETRIVRNLLFTCPHCEETRQGIQNFLRHGKEKHANKKMFFCKECLKGYSNKKSLDRHARAVHQVGTHLCQHCKQTYSRLDEFKKHTVLCGKRRALIEAESSAVGGHFCNNCQRKFKKSEKQFRRHSYTCKKYRKCPKCRKLILKTNQEQMDDHIKRRHSAQMNIDALLETVKHYDYIVNKNEAESFIHSTSSLNIAKNEISASYYESEATDEKCFI